MEKGGGGGGFQRVTITALQFPPGKRKYEKIDDDSRFTRKGTDSHIGPVSRNKFKAKLN